MHKRHNANTKISWGLPQLIVFIVLCLKMIGLIQAGHMSTTTLLLFEPGQILIIVELAAFTILTENKTGGILIDI